MRKFLLAAAVSVAMAGVAVPTQAATVWLAVAVNTHVGGEGHEFASSEEGARRLAMEMCEHRSGYTCPPDMTVSVPSEWYAVSIRCGNRAKSAGHPDSETAALNLAAQKLGYASYYNSPCNMAQSW